MTQPGREPRERELEVAIHAVRTSHADAAARYGVSRRQVSRFIARWQDTTEFKVARARLGAVLGDQFANLEQKAILRADAALDDPKTPARDVAILGKWASENRALATGGPTSRTETTSIAPGVDSMSPDDRDEFRELLDAMIAASPEERAEYAPQLVASLLNLPETP